MKKALDNAKEYREGLITAKGQILAQLQKIAYRNLTPEVRKVIEEIERITNGIRV